MSSVQSATTPDELLRALHWRYAVKKFDPSKKVPADIWKSLEKSLLLTPSSFGIQPWRFYVITDQALKDKLVPATWRQKQVAEASHVVVFAIRKNLDATDVGRFLERTAEVRNIPLASLDGFKKVLLGFIAKSPAEFDIDEWAARQVYIALGNFMTSAALLGIDTCPMEGFEPTKYDEILNLPKDGYSACVVGVAGYRSADDKYASTPKVRYKMEEVVKTIP